MLLINFVEPTDPIASMRFSLFVLLLNEYESKHLNKQVITSID